MANKSITGTWVSWAPYFHSILRIIAAAIFMLSGTIKLFSFPHPMPPEAGKLVLLSQVGIGGILEFVGGVLLLIGLFTRPVAFIMSGMMAVAYFQFHAPGGFWPSANGGTPAILFCFIFLFFSAAGAGPWSLDAQIGRKSHAAA
ncbi:DoxX family protein [bacterium]|nr:DoxX family protein [bacterium]